ncbi:glycosyltransferase [Methylococcus sp. EFPC2]|uniref:glycosyltransferase family 2 protein n=1 Tax=Methylococcus sp. EFPC2 TaxID=2812648 RepID=UPI001966CEDA|nr:glycosyltransferase [Methylococcus sp. EFPC2]QSA95596.1 glycosyltransferase [Methylococcus sp. EFPC2]
MISVIMPCFNSASYIRDAVESALGQTVTEVELIIVDDGSSDESLFVLRQLEYEHGQRITVLTQNNQGPYPARNLALAHAKGEYIAFLDADDWWDTQCLEKLRLALESSGADLTYCGWQNVGARISPPYLPPKYEEGDPVAAFLGGCPWPIHAALVKRSVIDKVGGFSTRYFSAMDYDLWLRILAVTQHFIQVPEVLAYYRWHDKGQISSNKSRQVNDAYSVRRDFIAAHPKFVKHISAESLRKLVDGFLYDATFTAFWQRDLLTAWRLSRKLLRTGYWKSKDLKYLLPSLLPLRLYECLLARRG